MRRTTRPSPQVTKTSKANFNKESRHLNFESALGLWDILLREKVPFLKLYHYIVYILFLLSFLSCGFRTLFFINTEKLTKLSKT